MFILIFLAMGSFSLLMLYAVNTLDGRIKSGNCKAAVFKACIITICPAIMAILLLLELCGLSHWNYDWKDYVILAPLSYGSVNEWRKVCLLYRQQRNNQFTTVSEVK